MKLQPSVGKKAKSVEAKLVKEISGRLAALLLVLQVAGGWLQAAALDVVEVGGGT